MDPDAIRPLLAIEQDLLRLLTQLEPHDPDRERLRVAHERLVAVLDAAVLRSGDILAEAGAILDHRPEGQ